MSTGLITAQEARNIALQFPNEPSKYMPAVLEAIGNEIRKAASEVERNSRYDYPVKKKKGEEDDKPKPHLHQKQCEKIVERLNKLGFTVEPTSEPHSDTQAIYGIRVTWPEKPEPIEEKEEPKKKEK